MRLHCYGMVLSGEPAGFEAARNAFQAAALCGAVPGVRNGWGGRCRASLRSCRLSRGTCAHPARPPHAKCASPHEASKWSLNGCRFPRGGARVPCNRPWIMTDRRGASGSRRTATAEFRQRCRTWLCACETAGGPAELKETAESRLLSSGPRDPSCAVDLLPQGPAARDVR